MRFNNIVVVLQGERTTDRGNLVILKVYVHEIVVEIHRRVGVSGRVNRRRVGVRAVSRNTCEYFFLLCLKQR